MLYTRAASRDTRTSAPQSPRPRSSFNSQTNTSQTARQAGEPNRWPNRPSTAGSALIPEPDSMAKSPVRSLVIPRPRSKSTAEFEPAADEDKDGMQDLLSSFYNPKESCHGCSRSSSWILANSPNHGKICHGEKSTYSHKFERRTRTKPRFLGLKSDMKT